MSLSPMKGTSGAAFITVAEFPAGRVGYRNLNNGAIRVRVEPQEGVTLNLTGWTQPEGHHQRYSTVVLSSKLKQAVSTATAQLLVSSVDFDEEEAELEDEDQD